MKILNLSGYTWENGGPAHVIFEHTEQQLKLGHEVDILSPYKEGDNFYPLPKGANLIKCKSNWISKILPDFSFETIAFLRKNIKKYDVIHVHGLWNFGGLIPTIFQNKAISLLTVHGTIGQFSRNKGKFKKNVYSALFQKRALSKFDIIHIYHPLELADLKDYMPQKLPKTVMIPNGVACDKYENLPKYGSFRQKYAIDKDKKIILFLGRLDAKKGIDLLMDAFAMITKAHTDSILVLVGPDYGMLDFIKEHIRTHFLEEKVILTGILKNENKLEAFVDADIFALPSYSEGFSIAGLEAMLCGLPIVVSDQVGYPEYVQKYETGFVVELQPEAIAGALQTLLEDDELRKKYGSNAIKLVKTNFDVSIVAKKLVDVMQEAFLKKNKKKAS
jgi:glycosyltransferase involved in cell wall biosynthesis